MRACHQPHQHPRASKARAHATIRATQQSVRARITRTHGIVCCALSRTLASRVALV